MAHTPSTTGGFLFSWGGCAAHDGEGGRRSGAGNRDAEGDLGGGADMPGEWWDLRCDYTQTIAGHSTGPATRTK